jgi:hypothetical protein
MATTRYKPLCDINFYHAFYENGRSPKTALNPSSALEISVSEETAAFFKQYELRYFSKNINSVSIYGEVQQDSTGKLFHAKELPNIGKWVLLVSLKEVNYLSLSDAPIEKMPNTCLYFSNLKGTAGAPLTNLHLTNNPTGINWQTDRVSLHNNSIYSYTHSVVVKASDVQLKNVQNNLLSYEPDAVVAKNTTSFLSFKLDKIESGLYELWIQGALIKQFYYVKMPPLQQKPWAVIEIYWDNTVAANYQWLNPDKSLKSAPPQYKINLEARKSFWQYQIAFKHLKDTEPNKDTVTNVKIAPLPITDAFGLVSNTDKEFIFKSQQALDWREQPNRKIGLTFNIGTKVYGKDILPYPSTSILQKDNTNQLIATILVNI